MIRIPKKLNYNVPEDKFRADLDHVLHYEEPKGRTLEKVTRLVYRITSLKHPRFTFMAGKSYRGSKLEALANDLETWLGEEFETMLDKDGGLSEAKLESLVGRAADIQIVHIDNDAHDHPFCHIQAVYAPGTFVADESAQKAA